MVDQGRSDFCVAFTMSLCALELNQTSIGLLFQVMRFFNQMNRLWEAIWSWLVNISFISYQIQKLVPERTMVKTAWRSDQTWSAIFSVIVYSHCFVWIYHFNLSTLYLTASCDGWHGWGRRRLLNLEHLVVLLAWPISHARRWYMNFVEIFNVSTGFVFHLFCPV